MEVVVLTDFITSNYIVVEVNKFIEIVNNKFVTGEKVTDKRECLKIFMLNSKGQYSNFDIVQVIE